MSMLKCKSPGKTEDFGRKHRKNVGMIYKQCGISDAIQCENTGTIELTDVLPKEDE